MIATPLQLDIDGATQYATLYAAGEPVATFQRRRVYETGPAWRAFDTKGEQIAVFFMPAPAALMARIVAKRLGIA